MGTLTCPRCRAKTQADSIDEGRCRLDHAIGIYLGKPCYDGLVELSFTGTEKKTVTTATAPQTEKPDKHSKKPKNKLTTTPTKSNSK